MNYQVTIKKVVSQSIIVTADNAEQAKYKASCQASDSDTDEILEVTDCEPCE